MWKMPARISRVSMEVHSERSYCRCHKLSGNYALCTFVTIFLKGISCVLEHWFHLFFYEFSALLWQLSAQSLSWLRPNDHPWGLSWNSSQLRTWADNCHFFIGQAVKIFFQNIVDEILFPITAQCWRYISIWYLHRCWIIDYFFSFTYKFINEFWLDKSVFVKFDES